MAIQLDTLDHLVLTVASLETTIAFYTRVLGMAEITFGAGRKALGFGGHKINLHQRGREWEPKALKPTPGSADLCFITTTPLPEVRAWLERQGVPVESGPVSRTGARGPLLSLYLRDPDGNLLELANQLPDPAEGNSGASHA